MTTISRAIVGAIAALAALAALPAAAALGAKQPPDVIRVGGPSAPGES